MSNFTKQLPNSRAVSVVSSWLTACNIPFAVDNENVITIQGEKPVKVNIQADNNAKEDAVNVEAKALLTKDIAASIGAFQNITEVAGFGRPVPVNRGPLPTKKLGYRKSEEFEYVAFRHREFRAAPNPDESEIKKYLPIIKNLSKSFYRKNSRLCELMGYKPDDIETYCHVWTVNFLHKYAIHNPTENDNEKLLISHLMQRLPELAVLLKRRAPNVKGTPEFGLRGTPLAGQADESYYIEAEEDPPDEEWMKRNRKIFNKSYSCRRKEARTILENSLEALPHDRMVGLLREASSNTAIEFDARKEAGKRLKAHVAVCDLCLTVDVDE